MKQLNKYFTFLGLYIAQSIPMSFFTTVVPVIMRQENYSLESIGLLQFVKLPWVIKFLWAPLIDKKAHTLGQYKKWIVGSELFYAIIVLSIGFFNLQTDFTLIVLLVVLAVFASATQDIATDALAVLSLKKEQRSMGNAVQSIGGFVGALVGSGVLLILYYYLGWKALLAGLSGFVLLALIPLKFFNYELKSKPEKNKVSGKSIFSFFAQKGIGKHVIFLLLSSSGLSGMMSMLKPYMVDHGYEINEIGFISGILGTAVATAMALCSGILLKHIQVKKCLILFSVLSIMTGFVFFQLDGIPFTKMQITLAVCLLWGAYGMINVAVYTLSMDKARDGLEGTDFTLQVVISQLGGLVVAGLSGVVAQKLNYSGLFLMEIFLAMLTTLYIVFFVRLK